MVDQPRRLIPRSTFAARSISVASRNASGPVTSQPANRERKRVTGVNIPSLRKILGLAVSAVALLVGAAPAAASRTQLAIFEVPNIISQHPATTLQVLRSLGVEVLRLPVVWASIAPNPSSSRRPHFDAANPKAYPAANWAPYDRVVRDAIADGIAVDLMPTGGAPLWATAAGAPPCGPFAGTTVCFQNDYFPSASDYGQFVRAVATRYGDVHFWELWNEANWGPSLTPQYYGASSVPVSAGIYRGLLDAGFSALQQTGHGHDTIISSSLSQDGSAEVGETGTSAPLTFLRTLYCVDSSFTWLTGSAASEAGCPTSRASYRRFRKTHPGLFEVTGDGIHPYPYWHPPTEADFPDPNGAEFAELPQLIQTVDQLQRSYGSHARLKIYNTEYGYQNQYVDAQDAAEYLNWAEYLSWQNPRIASYDQFELQDAGWFATGLVYGDGQLKPSFSAYRLPVWLPVTQAAAGQSLEVWGDVRPAHFAVADGHGKQYALVQFSAGGTQPFETVERVRIANPSGYFDVRVRFPGSGAVRLAWAYPSGDRRLSDPLDHSQWIYSQVVNISLG